VAVAAYRRKTFNNDRLYDNYIEEEESEEEIGFIRASSWNSPCNSHILTPLALK
jgi:hypothetical protein